MPDPSDDPVPPGLLLELDAAFRILEALEDALFELEERDAAPGLRDELATVIAGSTLGSGSTKKGCDERGQDPATG